MFAKFPWMRRIFLGKKSTEELLAEDDAEAGKAPVKDDDEEEEDAEGGNKLANNNDGIAVELATKPASASTFAGADVGADLPNGNGLVAPAAPAQTV
jgi:hypothetical protein